MGKQCKRFQCFLNGPSSASLTFIFVLFTQYYRKILDFSGIQTRVGRVEGEQADHLTNSKAQ